MRSPKALMILCVFLFTASAVLAAAEKAKQTE
jgi:hypothetical protein